MHRFISWLISALLPASGKAFNIKAADKWLLEWGATAPSGTPTSMLYINWAGVTTTTVIYANVNGTWTALTIN